MKPPADTLSSTPVAGPALTRALALVATGCLATALGFPAAVWPSYLTLGSWPGPALLGLVAAALLVGFVPPIARPVARPLDAAAAAGPAARRTATLLAGLVTAAYLAWTAHGQGRRLGPYVNDEFSYLIQARQLAAGRGWMPGHPLAPFFDSFQLLTRGTYASAYFPGTALLHVPGVWLGVPPWVTSVAVASAVAALVFHVAAELLDPAWAALAVLLLWSDQPFRVASTTTMSQMPVLLDGLIATAAWLAWRRHRGVGPAAAVAAALALAAVTRPVDALCFAVPIAADVALGLGRRPGRQPGRQPGRRSAVTVAVMAAAAAPFLALQLTLDRGITGHLLRTPFQAYTDQNYPGSEYGFHAFDPAARPASSSPQVRAAFDYFRPMIARHTFAGAVDQLFWSHRQGQLLTPSQLQRTLVQAWRRPFPLLLWLLPVAALARPTRRRWVVLAVLPLFVALYAGYAFALPHYVLTVAAALTVGVVAGAADLTAAMPSPSLARGTRLSTSVLIAGLAVAALPQWYPGHQDVIFNVRLLPRVDRALATLPPGPAVVLFAYSTRRTLDEEPVYNLGVAWPDDARIVRAHDLGPRADAALFRYYAARQPARVAYRYDEADDSLTRLGPVADLAR